MHKLPIDDTSCWLLCENIYPGLQASETIKLLLPQQKESFLEKCDWYREAIKQIYQKINLDDPVLKAFQHLHPALIVEETASISAVASLAHGLSLIASSLQVTDPHLDRQWRSMLFDGNILSGKWESVSLQKFWLPMSQIDSYQSLANFILQITALPQSTAVVEQMFSKTNLNKTKLRNRLAISTLESIAKVSEKFPHNFKVIHRLTYLYGKARSAYMDKYSESIYS